MLKSAQIFGKLLILSSIVVGIVFAGGYQLNEHSARAVGMGGAFAAQADDPSAIYFNPAGLAFQKGINILGGLNLIMPSTTFKGEGIINAIETKTNSQVFTPINLYGTYQINDKIVVGLGIYNPFGLGTEWPDLWGQAANSIYYGSQMAIKSTLQTWYINPSAAYKVNDQLSFGLGVSYVYGSVDMSRKAYLGGTTYATAKLTGTGSGFNVDLGAIYKPMEKLSLGLSYRITTKIDFSGDMKFSDVPSTMTAFFPGGTGKATLPMPGNLYIGAAYTVSPALKVEGDFQYVQWSAYDKLTIDVTPVVNLPAQLGGTQTQGPTTSIKNWTDGYLFRAGAEYSLNPKITLRGGLIADLCPQPPSKTEPMLPDADRADISVGGGYKINDNLRVDLAYMLVLFQEKDAKNSQLPGKYNSTAHVISVNVGYSF